MENSSFMAWSSQESVDSDGLFRCWRFVSKIHFCILSLIIYIFLFLFGVFCGLPPEFWIWNSSRFATVNGRSRKSDPLRWHFWSYSRTVEGAWHWTGRDGRIWWIWWFWCLGLGELMWLSWRKSASGLVAHFLRFFFFCHFGPWGWSSFRLATRGPFDTLSGIQWMDPNIPNFIVVQTKIRWEQCQ